MKDMLTKILSSEGVDFDKFRDEATDLTEANFGRERTLFNPIYISNFCENDCLYCSFRKSNKSLMRRTLSLDETKKEALFLKERGVSNLLILTGEVSEETYLKMLIERLQTIRKEVQPAWLGIETAPLTSEDYSKLFSSVDIDAVVLFQETYNRGKYSELHPAETLKADFEFRYEALGRAVECGVKEVGFGFLMGLDNWKDELSYMVEHAVELLSIQEDTSVRFSFPRIRKSCSALDSFRIKEVSEKDLMKAIIATRLLFPKAKIVLTGRESTEFLIEAMKITNVVGKGGSTTVGGYTIYNDTPQFCLNTDFPFPGFKQRAIDAGYDLG